MKPGLVPLHCRGHTARVQRAVALLETLVSAALVLVALLAIGSALSTSLRASHESEAQLVAQHAAERLIERVRATPRARLWSTWWADPGLSVEGGAVTGADQDGVLAAVLAEVLAPALERGAMGAPAVGPMLSLRLLGEREYGAAWGLDADLDHDGLRGEVLSPPAMGGPDPGYAFFPLLVEVRWRDAGGERSLQVMAAAEDEAPLDPERGS